MSRLDVIRAWKDEEYRAGLSEEERSLLPENPAGTMELSSLEVTGAAANAITIFNTCDGLCTGDFAPCSLEGGCAQSVDFGRCTMWICPTGGPFFCIPDAA